VREEVAALAMWAYPPALRAYSVTLGGLGPPSIDTSDLKWHMAPALLRGTPAQHGKRAPLARGPSDPPIAELMAPLPCGCARSAAIHPALRSPKLYHASKVDTESRAPHENTEKSTVSCGGSWGHVFKGATSNET
jgi:hypothetical protein